MLNFCECNPLPSVKSKQLKANSKITSQTPALPCRRRPVLWLGDDFKRSFLGTGFPSFPQVFLCGKAEVRRGKLGGPDAKVPEQSYGWCWLASSSSGGFSFSTKSYSGGINPLEIILCPSHLCTELQSQPGANTADESWLPWERGCAGDTPKAPGCDGQGRPAAKAGYRA